MDAVAWTAWGVPRSNILREREDIAYLPGIPLILWMFDRQGVFIKCEGDGLAALGLVAEQVIDKSCFDCIPEVPHRIDPLRLALEGEYITDCVEQDDQVWANWYYPIRGRDQDTNGAMCLSINITHHQPQPEQLITQFQQQTPSQDRMADDLSQVAIADMRSWRGKSAFGLRGELGVRLDEVVDQLEVDAARLYLCDPCKSDLKLTTGHGFNNDDDTEKRIQYGDGFAGHVALRRRPFLTTDLTHPGHTSFIRKSSISNQGFVAYCGIPLILNGCLLGVIEVFHRQSLDMDKEWFRLFTTCAERLSIAIDCTEQL